MPEIWMYDAESHCDDYEEYQEMLRAWAAGEYEDEEEEGE